MAAPEYSEEPTVTHDEEMYQELCRDKLVKVQMIPNKGKGVVSLASFQADDEVIVENALACAQNMDDMKDGIKCCAMTLKSLESPHDVLVRASPTMKDVVLPSLDEYDPPVQVVHCDRQADGCEQVYSSEAMRLAAFRRFHQCLCYGRMSPEQRAAYNEYISESWIQGGIDYSDTFHLGMHVMAIMFSSVRNGESVEEATAPFQMLISVPWQRFVFTYLLDEETPEEPEGEEHKRTKEQTLAKAVRLLRIVFGAAEDDVLLTDDRFSRLLGAILLNGQERRPTSPWVLYVSWLKANGQRKDYKSMKSLTKNQAKLQYSTRGQGVYRICSCFNHSCDPNIQVSYGDDNDETLVVNALRPIAKGEELCISYIDEDAPYTTRQEQLRDHYLFKCTCPKCTTEEQAIQAVQQQQQRQGAEK